jgi:hypothetical protein
MARTDHPSPEQVATICRIAHENSLRRGGVCKSLRELITSSDYRRLRPSISKAALTEYLADHPDVVTEWTMYSGDKRTSGGWYFLDSGQGWTVGHLGPDSRRTDERTYDSPFEACAEYLLLELDSWSGFSDG